MFVLDTNTLIYFFKGMGNVGTRLLETKPSEIAVPAIVVYELEVGLAKSGASERRRRELERFLELATVLSFDRAAASRAAEVRAALEQAGTPIGPCDLLIAGTSLSVDGTLITHNFQEFSRVKGLRIEDWF